MNFAGDNLEVLPPQEVQMSVSIVACDHGAEETSARLKTSVGTFLVAATTVISTTKISVPPTSPTEGEPGAPGQPGGPGA